MQRLSRSLPCCGRRPCQRPHGLNNPSASNLGGFAPTGLGSRTFDDVLLNEQSYLFFDPESSGWSTDRGEFLIAIGNHTEAGAGVGAFSNTTNSTYAALISDTGGEIQQQLTCGLFQSA
jgi:hypothetical protein